MTSLARTEYFERISSIISSFERQHLYNNFLNEISPIESPHNNQARLLRNGLSISNFCFFEDLIKQRTKSEDELKLFATYVLEGCTSLGLGYMDGIINGKDLLKILDKSDKFRDWLKNISEDKNLLGEYHKAVMKEDFSDKLPTKTARFVIFEGIGITLDLFGAGGIGTIAATALAAADNFLLDKIINRGWKPNQFIDKSLKPKIKI